MDLAGNCRRAEAARIWRALRELRGVPTSFRHRRRSQRRPPEEILGRFDAGERAAIRFRLRRRRTLPDQRGCERAAARAITWCAPGVEASLYRTAADRPHRPSTCIVSTMTSLDLLRHARRSLHGKILYPACSNFRGRAGRAGVCVAGPRTAGKRWSQVPMRDNPRSQAQSPRSGVADGAGARHRADPAGLKGRAAGLSTWQHGTTVARSEGLIDKKMYEDATRTPCSAAIADVLLMPPRPAIPDDAQAVAGRFVHPAVTSASVAQRAARRVVRGGRPARGRRRRRISARSSQSQPLKCKQTDRKRRKPGS